MDTKCVQWLHACVSELLDVPDKAWAKLTIGSLPVGSTGELTEIVATANRVASEHWASLLKLQQDDERLQPQREVRRHGVRVSGEAPGPLDSHYIHFAAFNPAEKLIQVSTASVKSVMEYLENAGLSQLLGSVPVLDVVLWHEYFHVWSYAVQKTAHKQVPRRWLFGRRTSQVQLQRATEELAAVEFSREASGLSFHPQLLQWLLIYTKNPRRAVEVAQNVLGKSW